MTLSSMTGFGRAEGHFENYSWVWEIRSVNGKSLDIRMRIPPSLDAVDQHIRETVRKNMTRGSVNVSLQLKKETAEASVNLNEEALDKLVEIAKSAAKKHDLPMPGIDRILSIRDVVEIGEMEDDEDLLKERDEAIKKSFLAAVEALVKSRESEGAATFDMLSGLINEIEGLLNDAENVAAIQPDALKAKFEEKVSTLLENITGLDPDRVAQEVVILATKADVREETDRLRAHIASARDLINENGPVGRKLDFLMQEFHRETNTLCSKSSDVTLTNIGVSMKTVIDQLREQVQNVE